MIWGVGEELVLNTYPGASRAIPPLFRIWNISSDLKLNLSTNVLLFSYSKIRQNSSTL